MLINAHTTLNLVVGHPVRHSESPRLHQRIYEALSVNAVMVAVENPSLADLVSSIKTLSVRLTAVTLPFKTAILAYVDSQSDAVRALQAANTLLLKNGQIHAENTDVDGIRHALSQTTLNGKNVLVVGAGGSARAVGYVLQSSNAAIYWLNRTPSQAAALANIFGGTVVSADAVPTLPIDIIINTTPIGMSPHVSETPLPGYRFQPHQTVFDLIYTPRETMLLRQARESGATCISGISMFIAQAWQQVTLVCDKKPDNSILNQLISLETLS